MARTKGRGIIGRVYSSYMFKEKDPILDAMRAAHVASKKSYGEVGKETDVSPTTLRNWTLGKTRRPQFATIAAVAPAYGKKGVLFNGGKPRLI